MTTRQVSFANQRGQRLSGVLHGEPSSTMAITCHGMLSTKEGTKHIMLADLLAQEGIATLRFDFAGRGDSEGELYDMTYSNEMQDLDAAVEHLVTLGAERVAVFGSSMGGAVAILTAARDERIVAIATLAAVGHPSEIEERYPKACADWRTQGYIELDEGRIGRTFLEDALEHDTASATRVIRAPLLILHGTYDDVVPTSDAHDIAANARNVELQIVDGADHRFSRAVHLRPAIRKVAQFLVDSLRVS